MASERQRLVGAISELYGIIQQMAHTYANDRNPNRAADMDALYQAARPIADPIINRYPPGYGENRHAK